MVEIGHILNLSVWLTGLGFIMFFRDAPRAFVIAREAMLWSSVATGCIYIGCRYWGAWPMTPMYIGTVALPPVLTFFGLITTRCQGTPQELLVRRSAVLISLGVGVASIFFPKDFYLPFLKTTSMFSHFHLIFTVLGKAALILGGLWALSGLRHRVNNAAYDFKKKDKGQLWIVLGFAFWTVSMFAGEVWSYRGWGIPVVWDDAVITTYMATWFYYIGLLHLHLTRSWNYKSRSLAAVFGVILILVLNCLPDLGPFRLPFEGKV